MSTHDTGAESMTVCQSCGSRNDKSFSFCTACGSNIMAGGAVGADSIGRETSESARQPSSFPAFPPPSRGRETSESARQPSRWPPDWAVSSEDLIHGQMVLIAARWIFVGAGMLLALLNPDALGELKVQIGLVLTLAVANFFLHAQILRKQTMPSFVPHLASAVDIGVITTIVIVAGGATSGLYVFYFPALFAISVTFPTGMAVILAGSAVGLYALVVSPDLGGDTGIFLVTRIIMMIAVVTCGMVYRRAERDRRREAGESY